MGMWSYPLKRNIKWNYKKTPSLTRILDLYKKNRESIQASFIDSANKYLKKFPKFKEIIVNPKNIMIENNRNIFFDKLGLNGYLIHTPEHSEDSISVVIEGLGVFTSNLPLSNHSKLETKEAVEKSWNSIRKTREKRIFPAHHISFEL
jgi:hypothetical protein